MPSLHFTDLAVSRLRTPGTYYDDATAAFGLRVGKNRKTWFVIRGKARLRTTIGRYPTLPLADARKHARALLIEPVTKQSRITFGAAYDAFKVSIERLKPRTQKDYQRLVACHFLPTLKTKKLTDLSFEDVTDCVKNVPSGEANHALAVAHIFLRWCVRPPRRYITHSPLEGISIVPANKRKRVLSAEEIPQLWFAAERQGYPHGTVVQLLMLTGQRRSEIANLRRSWINIKERTMTLPEWLTKNSKEHCFPYGDRVAAVLDRIPLLNSTDLLFPSQVSDDRPMSGWSKFKRRLDSITEGLADYCLHDLRRTYRTIHGQIGTPAQIAERLINHAAAVTTEVEEIYDRWNYLPQMRAAVVNFEKHFNASLSLHLENDRK